ncbi:MAG: hypothetical protein R3284_06080 [Rubricoccaceae bacterium]|nr:hypothetical protein [Rubricoccaceae bacterium]
MTLRRVIRIVFSILGFVYVLIGVAAIAGAAGWLPQAFVNGFLAGETITPLMGHVFQEFGALFVGLGGILLWYASRRELSPGFHWLVTFYFFLNASVHWVGPDGVTDSWQSGTFNSIPFAVLLMLGMLQRRHLDGEGKRSAA